MISVEIACSWPDRMTTSSGQHGELRLAIPTDDGEGMDGGTVTVVFGNGAEALAMLTSEVGRITELLEQEESSHADR